MKMKRTILGLLAMALAAAATQAEEPSIAYKISGNSLAIAYTGTLFQSTDAVNWAEVASASNPYVVTFDNKKLFFCAKGETSKNMTIPLSDTVSLDMIWVEPGTFLMGSPEDELGRANDETQYEVTLTKGYWLGKFEVTQAQYEAVMGKNPSNWKGADLPVEKVTWNDAMEFCAILTASEKAAGRLPEGYEYTLPTEAQWEYACRAGTTTALNSGKDLSDQEQCPEMDEVGWYKYNCDDKTHPVGQKLPNAWGLYDMHGNVREWCLDWYKYAYPTSAVTDPTGPETGTFRVIRGGGWSSEASRCRSAYRSNSFPDGKSNIYGFRVALTPVSFVPGKNITVPLSEDVSLDMIWIKPGTFMMGSPEDELGRYFDEDQHEVTLTQGYWLGKFEVTQAQYEAMMGTNPSKWKGAALPVEMVSWFDAKEFCATLTKIEKAAGRLPEGYEYTLPTEAQWEYACRAGTTTALNSGKNLSDSKECPEMDVVGWYKYNSDDKTHPVGQKQPNAWGLYDMHGNVEEWCLDRFGVYPTSAVTDPMGPNTGEYRVFRGGNWINDAWLCRSATRIDDISPSGISSCSGFRVALAPISTVPSKDMTIPLAEGVELDMIWIEPGTFIMGSPTDELGRNSNETQHAVTLAQGYWLGKYEVIQAQYEAVMGTNPSRNKGADLPVEQVSWFDAMEFCATLTKVERMAGRLPEGYEYTLPTEAQWEYACRAGTTTALNNGKDLSDKNKCPEMDEVGWYDDNSNKTYSVGQKQPNAWGLYDMHGNVFEWCLDEDWYEEWRILRGGAWSSYACHCRSAYRDHSAPINKDNNIGFRVVLAPVQ
jgi:formylglycine-generating enzyme required for sulfatase activity